LTVKNQESRGIQARRYSVVILLVFLFLNYLLIDAPLAVGASALERAVSPYARLMKRKMRMSTIAPMVATTIAPADLH
jgi:hypothetical protein